jgi:hypothetical protein
LRAIGWCEKSRRWRFGAIATERKGVRKLALNVRKEDEDNRKNKRAQMEVKENERELNKSTHRNQEQMEVTQ